MVKKGSLKYFIGYNDDDDDDDDDDDGDDDDDDDAIRPLCIKFPQIIGYAEHFDSNETMSFKASDNKVLKTYPKICERVSNLMNIKFDSEPVYGDNDKYIKAKRKTYGDNVDTNFQGNIIPKENT